jgi:hypothetical protein
MRKNVICYIRPVVGWYNLGININEKLKKIFLRKNEKLKGVVKKDKKIEYSKYKNPSCEPNNYSRFYLLSIANQRQDRNIRTDTAQTLTFTHRVNIIWCAVYSVLCIRTLSISNNLHNMTQLCAVHTMRWYLKKFELYRIVCTALNSLILCKLLLI